MFALHSSWWRTDTEVANFILDVQREKVHGSIVWIDCNKMLVHYNVAFPGEGGDPNVDPSILNDVKIS